MTLLKFLTDKTVDRHDAAVRAAVTNELAATFPDAQWEIKTDINDYKPENLANLWLRNVRSGIKEALLQHSKGESEYRDWIGKTHYVTISISPKTIGTKRKANEGWRISLIGFPAANTAAIGIASHYQGTMNNNEMAAASGLLRQMASEGLIEAGMNLNGRPIDPNDWNELGLIVRPVTEVSEVGIPTEVDDGRLALINIRTTTVKKILSSFISIEPLDPEGSDSDLAENLKQWADQAWALANTIPPFTSIPDFEAIRSLAIKDPVAAQLRMRLHKKSSTRSIVRIYYGPPGTGKTLAAVSAAVRLADPLFDDRGDPVQAFQRFNELREQVAFVTFHQALQYEDAIESIRPVIGSAVEVNEGEDGEGDSQEASSEGSEATKPDTPENYGQGLGFRLHEGVLLRMIRAAIANPSKEFVVVIDEINRGDISRILGPLISSLEPDKRLGAEYPIGIELQYPRSEQMESRLFLPGNVHFLGTMNSADRNIALVDHALRRRFEFILVPPEPNLLKSTTDPNPIDLSALLNALNGRIAHLMGAEYTIGHGYFMGCKTNGDVIRVMARKVIPLLGEYFFGNTNLLLLVLSEAPGDVKNIFLETNTDGAFESLFNVSRDVARGLGYRPHEANIALRFDPRFWDDSKTVPMSGDETYAATAIQKIYTVGMPNGEVLEDLEQ